MLNRARVLPVLWTLLCAGPAGAQVPAEARVGAFANPIDVQGADPDVLLDGGTYYMYATSAPGSGFMVWTSRDLVHWQQRGMAYQKSDRAWGQRDFWAPCVVKSGARYLMYYNAQPSDAPAGGRAHRICVAEATSPLGPFKDVAAPIWDPGDMVIDAQVLIDIDGRGHLYYANGSVWVVPLDQSLIRVAGDPVLCLGPSQDWERKWNEAPYVMRHGDKYVMFFSGPGYDMPEYSVGYALADAPTGPWVKPLGSPVLTRTPGVSGPGHNTVTSSPDGRELFMVYHTHQQLTGGDPRQIAVDRLRFVDDPNFGIRVEVDGPTLLSQRLPSGSVGPLAAANDEFDGKTLERERWTIVGEDPGAWRLDGGNLLITTQPGNVWQSRFDLRNLFLQAAPPGDFEAVTRVSFVVRQNFEQVFLIAWQDHNNYIRIANVYSGGRRWQITRELGGQTFSEEVPNTIGDTVWMKIARHGRTYECLVSVDGRSWWPVGPPLAADFAEVQVGIGAASPGSSRRAEASFDCFRFASGGLIGPTLGRPEAPKP